MRTSRVTAEAEALAWRLLQQQQLGSGDVVHVVIGAFTFGRALRSRLLNPRLRGHYHLIGIPPLFLDCLANSIEAEARVSELKSSR